ncbi:UvrD/REP helicase [Caldithrix abyssi DSM 13497]|uniref:DNA 3'-5' helicase n=1 Tax=Caldithrix abyssi DSM 13497 TaxID=880073 RepID=H1XUR6_CALAY|nr:ATP-dependent DNA helicase [Caldithrix abyssi]APF17519.1 DNA helicase-2 / ATP-dependent DNA helicase PcrA [Caldithrix abyssi DSM 13497]EHO41615.1 UvrD/REP helicase [Caldithrix abyssi DSM 13497]
MEKLKQQFIETFELQDDLEKQKAIFETDGPTLIIAGPGTGKTYTLVLRTLFILLSKRARPSEIILTSFTEKSALELRDRLGLFARRLGVKLDLHELVLGTIHSICDHYINQFIRNTPLSRNYTVLDDLTNSLFIYEHWDEIGEPFRVGRRYFGRWISKWDSITRIKTYFDKITEEMVEPDELVQSSDDFLQMLGESYQKYRALLFENNKVDFAFQQRIFYDVLKKRKIGKQIRESVKYLLIDEYQDTNYIQEQIALTLVKPHQNICVVGDEDQALYRFRGATVRNILEFPHHFKNVKIVKLLDNYRSHQMIIDRYNAFIESVDWSNPDGGPDFRFDKKVRPAKSTASPDYPAVFTIWGENTREEARRFADLVQFLKKQKIIQDYSDVALLLHSVKLDYSEPFIQALQEKNIPAFCPRARAYFENEEVKMALACYLIITGYLEEDIKQSRHADYFNEALKLLGPFVDTPLAAYLQRMATEIQQLSGNETIDENVMDFLYQLFAYEPFYSYLKDENKARNLSIFSSLLNAFQTYYHLPIITAKNKQALKYRLFNSFFNLLLETGLNEYEDQNDPIPKGYVQIMTIHQSKGLEFPVVVVSSLDKRYSVQKQVDRLLRPFYRREPFEPEDRIHDFDWARLFYVAFSRPQKLLVLSTGTEPKDFFRSIWEGLEQWPYVQKETLKAQQFKSRQPFVPKKTFSLTSHINVYETCPRQYQFYKDLEFTPSRTGQLLFGTLVHQTIEDIHRAVLDGEQVNEPQIADDFERNYRGLIASGYRPLGKTQKEQALKQVVTYFQNNKDLLARVVETEVDVSYEKEDYIISGKVDLLLGKDDRLELLDFKSQQKPQKDDPIIEKYTYQLHVYAHILKERYGKEPERLYIYWTAEDHRKDALQEIPYDPRLEEAAGHHFDHIAHRIIQKDYTLKNPPDKTKVCKECDFRYYCKIREV